MWIFSSDVRIREVIRRNLLLLFQFFEDLVVFPAYIWCACGYLSSFVVEMFNLGENECVCVCFWVRNWITLTYCLFLLFSPLLETINPRFW